MPFPGSGGVELLDLGPACDEPAARDFGAFGDELGATGKGILAGAVGGDPDDDEQGGEDRHRDEGGDGVARVERHGGFLTKHGDGGQPPAMRRLTCHSQAASRARFRISFSIAARSSALGASMRGSK